MTIEGILKLKGPGVVTIESGACVGDAICIMRHRGVGALVVSTNGRKVDGMISEHDLIRALRSYGVGRLMPMQVADIMCRYVLCCGPGDSVRRVMARMSARRQRHMPVVNDNGICGIVSMDDVVNWRLAEAEEQATAGPPANVRFNDLVPFLRQY